MQRIKKIILTGLALVISAASFSQKKGQKALFDEFMQVCNAYKQLPLYLNLGYQVTCNVPGAVEDTSVITGEFYITPGQAYVKFGSMEQVLTDTLGVVIMNDIKHIAVHQNNIPIEEQVKAMLGKPLSQETLQQLTEKYTITKKILNKQNAVFRIESKNPVYEGLGPSTTIELAFNTTSQAPQKVITYKRSLFKVDENHPADGIIKKVEIDGKGTFGVKETTTSFFYNKIEHTQGLAMPVTIKDRIKKGGEENLLPARGFEDYYISEN